MFIILIIIINVKCTKVSCNNNNKKKLMKMFNTILNGLTNLFSL